VGRLKKETMMISLIFKSKAFALSSVFALSLSTQNVQAQNRWDLPSGYGANTFQVQNLQQFADGVEKASGGKLKITVHSNASLFKANEIKRAVQSGQTAVGEFILSGASNESPIFGIDSIPFLATSYPDAKRLDALSRVALNKTLSTQGIKLLYTAPWPPQGLYSVKPVSSIKDLRGTKMRAYNPATSVIATTVGAQPVTIQLAELPAALATGGVDNFLTSSASGVDSKLYESVKHFYDVNAWLPRNAVVVNQKAFDALDKATQEAVLAQAAAAETRGWQISEQKDGEYMRELSAKGMKVDLTSDVLKKELKVVGDKMIVDWLKLAGDEGKAIIDAFNKK
jgi:TRAP-type transport system periplasmic protein